MEYGPAPESQAAINKWLDEHQRKFGLFINNQWMHPEGRSYLKCTAPATKEFLADTIQATKDDVEVAVKAANDAFKVVTVVNFVV